jgi:hypothetical protein
VLAFCRKSKMGGNMNRGQTKKKIKQLKEQVKAHNKATDFGLLKLFLLMVILAVIAAIVHGRIQLW